MNTMATKLINVWEHASEEDREAGAHWYDSARAVVRNLAERYNVSRSCVAGIVAATSPRIHWSRNIAVAESILTNGTATGVFKASLRKAQRILSGEKPLKALKGPKVRAFYRALMGDNSAAVVDVWIAKAVGWTKDLKQKAYERIEAALREAASKVGVAVAKFQAAVWVAIRGRST